MPAARPSEHHVMANMLLRFGRGATRLFRINSGMGWVGKILSHTPDLIVLERPRPFHGAPPGSADLLGWHTVTVTPEMVGRRLAVFVAIEVKSATGRATAEQQNFGEAVRRAGGIAVVARNEDQIAAALDAATIGAQPAPAMPAHS